MRFYVQINRPDNARVDTYQTDADDVIDAIHVCLTEFNERNRLVATARDVRTAGVK